MKQSDRLTRMLATWFYVGDFPLGPGTLASFVALLMYIILHQFTAIYVGLFVIITVVGFIVSGPMERITGRKDPGCVVIDEVSGAMIGYFLLPLHNIPVLIVAFFLFRAFDMFKIYPVNKFEEIGGGVGIMADDICAGVYTFFIMQAAIRMAGII